MNLEEHFHQRLLSAGENYGDMGWFLSRLFDYGLLKP